MKQAGVECSCPIATVDVPVCAATLKRLLGDDVPIPMLPFLRTAIALDGLDCPLPIVKIGSVAIQAVDDPLSILYCPIANEL